METAFYVIGSALVVIALIISFIGMRSDSFPSAAVLRIGVAFVAAVVIATAVLAVRASNEEQAKRLDEENAAASAEEEAGTADNEASGVSGSSDVPTDQTSADQPSGGVDLASGDAQAGAQVFTDSGCASCHSLEDAGATGDIGPNLDEALADKDPTFILTSIVDPSAEVEEGFPDGTMPSTYGDDIPPDQLADLVAYLSSVTSSVSK